ncbi:Multidrug resistance protein stp [Novacetimonas maltaceti]|uniref:Multidrug resistance protein stp n=2 Tax=Novacetimonas maltaceti TaxID=1203393 RepID=A0A2S3W3C9_9PROT|nr:Multidrug resistance protein stp [Novacetimonas maltaceti]
MSGLCCGPSGHRGLRVLPTDGNQSAMTAPMPPSRPDAAAVHPAPLHPAIVLVTCCLSLLLVMMDVTIVNVALPSIRTALHGSFSTLQWVVDGYTLMVASLLVLMGAIADRLGRRRVFVAGISVFCLGSMLCALSGSIPFLVGARMLQGIGGAMLNPVALSIIANVFTEPRARAQAIGVWGGASGVALALGPVVGGVLVHWVNWQAVFWVNVPIGIVAIFLSLRFIPESRAPHTRPFDAPGQLLVMVTLAMLTAALIEVRDFGWGDPVISGFLSLGVLAMVGFVIVEQRSTAPLVDLRFFHALPFSGAIVTAILAFAVFSAFLFLNTLYLQGARGMSALHAGLCTLPFAVCSSICAPLSGRLVGRIGARVPLLLSALGFGCSALLLTGLSATTPLALLLVAYGLCGCGFGLCNAPITNAAVAGMPRSQAGVAAALASTSRQVGVLLGIALCGTLTGGAAGQAGTIRWALFAQATHRMWWGMFAAALLIGVIGIIVTSARARASTQAVAALMAAGEGAAASRRG